MELVAAGQPGHAPLHEPPFAKRQDIRHVQRALCFLQPGGTMIRGLEAPQAPRFDRDAPAGPQDFTARPRAAHQALFFTDEPTWHGTAPLEGYGGGELADGARGHSQK